MCSYRGVRIILALVSFAKMFVRSGSSGPFQLLTVAWIFLLCSNGAVLGQILTPPYFNLAEGRAIHASATCGDEGPEQFCKLVGASGLSRFLNFSILNGQVKFDVFVFKYSAICE